MSDLETLALAAALLLALTALLTAWAAHRHLQATAALVANLRAETTELHRARNTDAARLNQLYAWAHGATHTPDPDPAVTIDPATVTDALRNPDRRHLPPPPDRRTGPDRRRGAHRPADDTTEMTARPTREATR